MNRIDAFLELAVQQGGSDLHPSGQPPRIRHLGRPSARALPRAVGARRAEFRPSSMTPSSASRSSPHGDRLCVRLAARPLPRQSSTSTPEGIRRRVPRGGRHAADARIARPPRPSQQVLSVGKGLDARDGPDGLGQVHDARRDGGLVNRSRTGHIITIEDPIEYLHDFGRSVVTQRESARTRRVSRRRSTRPCARTRNAILRRRDARPRDDPASR